jgi:hypothetical protein
MVQVMRHDADVFTQFPDVPVIPAENLHPGIRSDHRVQLAVDRLEQGCLARTIRTQYRDTLMSCDFEVEMLEYAGCTAPDSRVPDLN